MLGVMMPRRPGLSHLNFVGAGPVPMRQVMRQQHVMSLNELIDAAREQGVKMIACTMTMDLMGLRRDELIDGVVLVLAVAGRAGERGQRVIGQRRERDAVDVGEDAAVFRNAMHSFVKNLTRSL
jgi:hypothetical protein